MRPKDSSFKLSFQALLESIYVTGYSFTRANRRVVLKQKGDESSQGNRRRKGIPLKEFLLNMIREDVRVFNWLLIYKFISQAIHRTYLGRTEDVHSVLDLLKQVRAVQQPLEHDLADQVVPGETVEIVHRELKISRPQLLVGYTGIGKEDLSFFQISPQKW